MLIAQRPMVSLNGHPVAVGQVLDAIWPTLRERTRRVLVSERWVKEVPDGTTTAAPTAVTRTPTVATTVKPRRRGRPKGSKNRPKPAAPEE